MQMAGPSSVAIEKETSKSPLRICTTNRNRADFCNPDERNEFHDKLKRFEMSDAGKVVCECGSSNEIEASKSWSWQRVSG